MIGEEYEIFHSERGHLETAENCERLRGSDFSAYLTPQDTVPDIAVHACEAWRGAIIVTMVDHNWHSQTVHLSPQKATELAQTLLKAVETVGHLWTTK
jgi:hypothetical protein